MGHRRERQAAANGKPPRSKPPAPGTPLSESRARYEAARAREKEILVRKLEGSLIDRDGVLRTVRAAAQMTREAVEQWPAQHAAVLASRLGLDDPHLVETVLSESLHGLLIQLADRMAVELRASRR
jgi:hypothetical protein